MKPEKKARSCGRVGSLDHPPDRFLDVHRRCCEPNLNLDAPSSFEAGPSQPVELFRQAEGSFYKDLPFDEALLAQRPGQQGFRCIDKLLAPGAMDSSFPPRGRALLAKRTGGATAFWRSILDALRALDLSITP